MKTPSDKPPPPKDKGFSIGSEAGTWRWRELGMFRHVWDRSLLSRCDGYFRGASSNWMASLLLTWGGGFGGRAAAVQR